MKIDNIIEYSSILLSLALLWFIRRNIKKYIPVGLLASGYAVFIDQLGSAFNCWKYNSNIFPALHGVHMPLDYIVVPALTITFVKYVPRTIIGLVLGSLVFTFFSGGIEYLVERYTDIIKFGQGYVIWFSLLIWLILWPIAYLFHVWLWDENGVSPAKR